jgi:hypothetical protein
MPFSRNSSSKSVAQKELLPGLSMTVSEGAGASSANDLPAGLATHEDLAVGTRIADAGADLARAPALVGGKIGEVGAVALARVEDVVALAAQGGEHAPNGRDGGARQRDIEPIWST